MTALTPDGLARSLRAAGFQRGDRFEVAALASRMVSTFQVVGPRGINAAARFASTWAPKASLYLRLNPIRPDTGAIKAAKDEHIAAARVILLDLDPHACKRVKSGDKRGLRKCRHAESLDDHDDLNGIRPDKLEAAAEVVAELRAFVEARLGVVPALLDSGRGRQLWLPTPVELTREERRRFLQGLARRYDREAVVEVDLKCFNASRLARLPGGRNKKTGSLAQILDDGDGQTPGLEAFRALIDELAPPKPKREPRARGARPQRAGPDQSTESPWTRAIRDAVTIRQTMALLGLDPLDGEGRGPCPIHGGTNPRSFSADWEPGLWTCHAECGSGDVISLVSGVQGVDRPEARAWLAERIGVERPAEQTKRLPLWKPRAMNQSVSTHEGEAELARVYQGQGGAVLDARATGSGKTYEATRRTIQTTIDARSSGETSSRVAWAVPSHEHADQEILPSLEAAARELGAGDHTSLKLPVFDCPLPDGVGEAKNAIYANVAAMGWNAAQIVCLGCPRFGHASDNPCSYWDERKEATQADTPVLQHAHLGLPGVWEGAAFERVRALVVDEDPSDQLLERHEITPEGIGSFRRLLDEAISEHIPEDVARQREEKVSARLRKRMANTITRYRNAGTDDRKRSRLAAERLELERLEAEVDRAELEEQEFVKHELGMLAASAVDAVLQVLTAACQGVAEVEEVEPGSVSIADLLGPGGRWLEARATAELRKRREEADDGPTEQPPRNLWPAIRQIAELWQGGRPAVFVRVQGSELSLPRPVGLPADLGLEILDATGSVGFLQVVTKRRITVRGAAVDEASKVPGLHLAGLSRGRARFRGTRGKAALERDAATIARYARSVGARTVGLVTFLDLRKTLPALLERHGIQVKAVLHWGAVAGSNVFREQAVDLAVIHGTPHVPPSAVRELAIILGADAEELRQEPIQEHYRTHTGAEIVELAYPEGLMRIAHRALVDRALVQALGRAYRGDWTPARGLLVLAQATGSPVCSLRMSTAHDEGLAGEAAGFLDALERELKPPARALMRERMAQAWASTTGAGGRLELADLGVELARQAVEHAGDCVSLGRRTGWDPRAIRRAVTRIEGTSGARVFAWAVWRLAVSCVGLASEVERAHLLNVGIRAL